MKQATLEATAEQPTRQRSARGATGPRTERGKRISSKNALKHGFLSKEVVLQGEPWGENPAEFKQLLNSYLDHFKPVGPVEMDQLELAVIAFWRYRRVLKAERGMILGQKTWEFMHDLVIDHWRNIAQDESRSEVDRRVAEYFWELRGTELDCKTAIPSGHDIQKLQRAEAHHLRVHYRALNELERLQRMRLGDTVPAPVVVDVQN